MDTWTEQPGFPVVTLKNSHRDNSVVVSQRRYLTGINPHIKYPDPSIHK